MVVYRNGQNALCEILPDHVVHQNVANLARSRDAVSRSHKIGLVLFANDIHAKLDALITDEDRRARN